MIINVLDSKQQWRVPKGHHSYDIIVRETSEGKSIIDLQDGKSYNVKLEDETFVLTERI